MATAKPVLIANRILHATTYEPYGGDNADVSISKPLEFIVAFQLDEEKGPWTAAYKLQWRDVTDASGFSDLAATGEIQWGTNTSLTNGGQSKELCEAYGAAGSTIEVASGTTVEGASTSGSFNILDEYYVEVHFAVSLVGATVGHQYDFQLYDNTNSSAIGIGAAAVTVLSSPPTVALGNPADGDTLTDTTPPLAMTGTDPEGDEIEYEVQIDTVSTFNSVSTPAGDYSLKYVDIKLGKIGSPTDNILLDVRSGSCSGTSLGQVTLASSSIVAAASGRAKTYYRFTFTTPISITGTTKYYITVARSGAYDLTNNIIVGSTTVNLNSSTDYYSKRSGTWSSAITTEELDVNIYDTDTVLRFSTHDPINVKVNVLGATTSNWSEAVGQSFVGAATLTPARDVNSVDNSADFYHDGSDTHPFTSGHEITYTVPDGSPLSATEYFWRARGKDSTGVWGSWATYRHFHVSNQVVLVVANTSQLQTSEGPALTQHNVLVVNNSTNLHNADNADIQAFLEFELAVSSCYPVLSSDNVAIVQHNILVVGDSSHAHTADNATLTPHYTPAPPTVALDSPANAGDAGSSTPALLFTGSDINSDEIEYQIQVDTLDTFDGYETLVVVDSNDDTTYEYSKIYGTTCYGRGQSFEVVGTGQILQYVQFYLNRINYPGGALQAKLYSHLGSYGTNSNPGSLLATSTTSIDCDTLVNGIQTFYFNDYEFDEGYYVVTVEHTTTTGDTSNYIDFYYSGSGAAHPGNYCWEMYADYWGTGTYDGWFRVYAVTLSSQVDAVSTSDAGFTGTGDPHPWPSGNQITYTVQTALSPAGTFYWRVRGKDPGGSNTWGDWSATGNFHFHTVPIVTTVSFTEETPETGLASGTISDDGNLTITRRGFCYILGTGGDPTTADSVTYEDGSYSEGAYSLTISGLSSYTHYHIRAYAVNSLGTSYGITYGATTTPYPPVVTLNSPADDSDTTDTTPDLVFTGVTDGVHYPFEAEVQITSADSTMTSPFCDSVSSESNGPSATYVEWNHTLGFGADRMVIIGVATRGNIAVTGVTFDGVAATYIRNDNAGSDRRSELWYIAEANLPVEGTYVIRVTVASSTLFVAGAVSYVGVTGLGANTGTTGGATTSSSLNVTTATGRVVVDVIAMQSVNSGLAADASQVQRVRDFGLQNSIGMSSETATGASTNMAWTFDNEFFATSAVVLIGGSTLQLNKYSTDHTGFSGTPPYNNNTQVTYTVQAGDAFIMGDSYSWRARGIDPQGTNIWGPWSETWVLNVAMVLVISTGTHLQTSDTPALVQHNILVVSDCSQLHTANTISLTLDLIVNDTAHAHTVDNTILVQHHVLSMSDSSQAHTADSPALVQHNILASLDSTHVLTSENCILDYHELETTVLEMSSATHEMSDNLTYLGLSLITDDSLLLHTSQNISLLENPIIYADSTQHLLYSDEISLIPVLVVDNATQLQEVDSFVLVHNPLLTVSNATHLHTASNLVFSAGKKNKVKMIISNT